MKKLASKVQSSNDNVYTCFKSILCKNEIPAIGHAYYSVGRGSKLIFNNPYFFIKLDQLFWIFRFKDYIKYDSHINLHKFIYVNTYCANNRYSNYDMNVLMTILFQSKFEKEKKEFALLKNVYIKNKIRLKYTRSRMIKKITAIDIFLKKFIENYIENKVMLCFDNYGIGFFNDKSKYLRLMQRKLRRAKKYILKTGYSLSNFLRITLIFLATKDIDIFLKILIKILNNMHFKKHKNFLYYLKLFITKSTSYYYELLNFEGFYFLLSGKISGAGNSKKKRYAIRSGRYSLTTKILKVKYRKGLIYTKTGVLGFKFIISYN